MAKKTVVMDLSGCLSCSICVQACPISALTLTRMGFSGKYSNLFPEPDPEKCVGCGICVKSCPMDCLTLGEKDES